MPVSAAGSSFQGSRYPGQGPSRVAYGYNYQSSHHRGHNNRNQSLSSNNYPGAGAGTSFQSHFNGNQQQAVDNRPLPSIPMIPEEDECPVCHRELPSRTLPDFEAARAIHITQCIDEQIALHNGHTTRPGAFTSQSQPSLVTNAPATTSPSPQSDRAASPPETLTLSQAIGLPQPTSTTSSINIAPPILASQFPNTPEGRTAAREAQHAAVVFAASGSHSSSPSGEVARRTGMFPYKATEKDCVDDAECTICLEEFEVGVGMARLECLCRFHSRCIREWFVNHPGRCPVHQHDGYGY